jgi:hypothetical protein
MVGKRRNTHEKYENAGRRFSFAYEIINKEIKNTEKRIYVVGKRRNTWRGVQIAENVKNTLFQK